MVPSNESSAAAATSKFTVSPEDNASWLSIITYSWLKPLLKLGYRGRLEQETLYPLGERDRSTSISDKFDRAWQAEMERSPQHPSIFRAIHHSFGREFYWSGLHRLIGDLATVFSPLLLQLILVYIRRFSSGKPTNTNGPTTMQFAEWEGYLMVVGLFLLQMMQTVFINLSYAMSMRTGYYLRTAIISSIFKKSLRLSARARRDHTSGKIMNMISTDTNRLDLSFMIVHFLWSAPLQILIAFGMLWWYMGPTCLVGFAVIVMSIPFQLWVVRKQGEMRDRASKVADQRIKILQELLQGIKVVKLYAWEDSFAKLLDQIRKNELKSVAWLLGMYALNAGLMQTVPIIACVITFIVYSATGNQFTTDFAYFALALFYVLRIPLIVYPSAISRTIDSIVAFKRVQELLMSPELDSDLHALPAPLPASTTGGSDESENNYAVRIENGSFIWETASDSPVDSNSKLFTGLHGVNLNIKRGSLVAIIGSVGSGKSSLAQAIIGEMKRSDGRLMVDGSLAYCAQNAWIQNMTLKDNILFGSPFNGDKYSQVIHDCALESDLKILLAGDLTEIGEKGVNLSGGQKQRINLARAAYSDSDIVVMDDPLSAVDVHVGAHIFEHCILEAMARKTRILVTHRLNILPDCDHIVVMLNGRIVEQGAYDELMGRGGELKSILEAADIGDTLSRTNNPTTAVKKPQSPTGRSAAASSTAPDGASKTVGKLISSEERATGQIGVRVYLEYAKLIGGYWVVAVLAMVMILAQGSRIITDLWLNIWATGQLGWTTGNYQGMYAGLGMIQVLLMVSIGLMFSAASVVACRRIHRLALERVLASPIAWFDSQPLGRLINRFSRDMDTMDSLIPESVRVFCYTISMTISLLLTICVALWLFIIPLVPVLLIYWYTQHFYRRTSIDLKRLDNVSRSPLFAQISETFVGSGQSTIRAYNAQQRFIAKNLAMLDYNNRSYYLTILTQRWLSLRLETLASLLTFFAALFGVIGKDSLDPGLIGIALTYSLQVTFVFNWAVRQSTEVEMYMNSLERLMHYVYELEDENVDGHQAVAVNNNNNTSEGIPLKTISIIPDSDWPRSGNIKFNEVSLRYRPDLPDVLQQVTLTINDGEKVGIVGRTGAGKSSLINALFLLNRLRTGSIIIDGIDTATIPLKRLRSSLAIIPQDPVIFSGTIRDNLDPLNQFDDDKLWTALKQCGIYDAIDPAVGLQMPVSEGGENWSTGQRQLICLARALLKQTHVLVLDEATASVDMATDALIQRTLRQQFAKTTIITIAHRLNTIMDYDKIVVMDRGVISEVGSPSELIAKNGGLFASMVNGSS